MQRRFSKLNVSTLHIKMDLLFGLCTRTGRRPGYQWVTRSWLLVVGDSHTRGVKTDSVTPSQKRLRRSQVLGVPFLLLCRFALVSFVIYYHLSVLQLVFFSLGGIIHFARCISFFFFAYVAQRVVVVMLQVSHTFSRILITKAQQNTWVCKNHQSRVLKETTINDQQHNIYFALNISCKSTFKKQKQSHAKQKDFQISCK